MQVKTGQDLPKENLSEGLEEVLGSYKAELGLTDKEAEALEHLQASVLPALPCPALPCPCHALLCHAPIMPCPAPAMPSLCPALPCHALIMPCPARSCFAMCTVTHCTHQCFECACRVTPRLRSWWLSSGAISSWTAIKLRSLPETIGSRSPRDLGEHCCQKHQLRPSSRILIPCVSKNIGHEHSSKHPRLAVASHIQ